MKQVDPAPAWPWAPGGLLSAILAAWGIHALNSPLDRTNLVAYLDRVAGSKTPGLQYIVVDADRVLFEYAGGWADIQAHTPMTRDTTLMGYSMTKTITAVAVLQLVEQGKIRLDDEMDGYLPATPYRGRHITVRQLLDHTSGIPNPIPLRWVHLHEDHARFDEAAALAQVLRDNPRLDFDPGERFSYSNIGYWLLGQVIEGATQQSYVDTMRANVLGPLRVSPGELSFDVSDLSRHAQGYLARFSFLNLAKGLFTDRKFWGGYTGNWLVLKSHMLNGPSFGGLVGSARGFSIFLQDQLRDESVMLDAQTRSLLETQQTTLGGDLIPMTLGWHTGEAGEVRYLYKEGGGGGFHAEMRLYPTLGIASVVMVNTTEFNSTRFLNELDRLFYEEIVHLFVHPIR